MGELVAFIVILLVCWSIGGYILWKTDRDIRNGKL
jgi:hypothetical protein